MSRSRIIKPGYFKNEVLCMQEPLVRILFAGIWTLADREGRLEDRPMRIKIEVLPYDNVDVDAMLAVLHNTGFIRRYEVSGTPYIQILTWDKHQSPHVKEAASIIPAPDEHGASTVQASDKHGASTPCVNSSVNSNSSSGMAPSDKPKAARRHRIPENFELTDQMREWAASKGYDQVLDLEQETEEFVTFWRGDGEPKLDWYAVWQNRITKQAEYVQKRGGTKNGNHRQQGQTLSEFVANRAREAGFVEEADRSGLQIVRAHNPA